MKRGVKGLLAPELMGRLKSVLRVGNHYHGVYPDWATASAHASGYDAPAILERVRDAARAVRSGAARYERDGVVFEQVEYSFPVLSGLLHAVAGRSHELSVLDFGGALGSTYQQCREFLDVISTVKWGIVEQPQLVTWGRAEFETEQMTFHDSVGACVERIRPNVALFSSVLQYLNDPYVVLGDVVASEVPYIIIDRTLFSDREEDRFTIQHVPARIYPGSYPVRIFGRGAIKAQLEKKYRIVAEFDASWDGSHIEYCGGVAFRSRGMILSRRRESGESPASSRAASEQDAVIRSST